jgi:hypothetical protein
VSLWTMVKYALAFIGGCIRGMLTPSSWRRQK